MGAPVNTLAGMLLAAYFIYVLKHGQLATLMGIIGLAGSNNLEPRNNANSSNSGGGGSTDSGGSGNP